MKKENRGFQLPGQTFFFSFLKSFRVYLIALEYIGTEYIRWIKMKIKNKFQKLISHNIFF